ncbi:MAG: hypothetical protein BWY31_04361 [Lentisphaerae bacterium ADurb.Bin242]|nr:MAG: hypothetical protein BWY31_04361 [Lentisphaerae bacterium ADurb.Bin242]
MSTIKIGGSMKIVPSDARVLSPEQVGRIRGLCDALRIVASGNTDIEQLSISIELELNSELRTLRDLQQQADAEKKAHPMYCIQVELSRKSPDPEPGKAVADAKESERHDTPPAPKKRKGMPLSQYIDTLPLDAEAELREAYLKRFIPPWHSAAETIELLLTRPDLMGETITQSNLARLLHVSNTTVSLARHGKIRPILKARLAEILGWEGGAK